MEAALVPVVVGILATWLLGTPVWGLTSYYVDPDFGGSATGAAATPWTSLTAGAGTTINPALASDDVTVFFSARAAGSDIHETTTTQIQLKRTDTGTKRLTLDGMSQYNTDDATPSWSAYAGPSRFEVSYTGEDALAGHAGAPTLQSYTTVRGFRLFSTSGKPLNFWGGNEVVIEQNTVAHLTPWDGAGAGIQIQYVRKAGDTENPCVADENHNCGVSNVIIRDNTIFDVDGEGIYIGGLEDQDFPEGHSNIIIERNTIYDTGKSASGEGDGIDIKDGVSKVIVRGNTIYQTDPTAGRDGIVAMGGGLFEDNFIYDTGRGGIILSVTWNAKSGPRDGTVVRGNLIVNVGGDASGAFNYGIAADGDGSGDQWTNLTILSNSVYQVRTSSGDGKGIFLHASATPTSVFHNVVFQEATGDLPFHAQAGALGANHDHNNYHHVTGGANVAQNGVTTYTAATIATFEGTSISTDPLFVTHSSPYTRVEFALQRQSSSCSTSLGSEGCEVSARPFGRWR